MKGGKLPVVLSNSTYTKGWQLEESSVTAKDDVESSEPLATRLRMPLSVGPRNIFPGVQHANAVEMGLLVLLSSSDPDVRARSPDYRGKNQMPN